MVCSLSALVMLTGGLLADAAPTSPAARVAESPRPKSAATGETLARRERLRPTIEQSPQDRAAHWRAGYVWQDERWQPYEASARPAADGPLRREYQQLRNQTAGQSAAQLRLADWCREHGLPDRERVHLTQALWLSNGREMPGLRERLGYHLIAGRWMTERERAAIEQLSRDGTDALRQWGSKLEGIAARLLQGPPPAYQAAVAELDALDDPAALPAVEAILSAAGEEPARQAVRYFARIDRYQSTLALARQAVFSTWPSVRRTAIEALKSRRLDDFAPAVLTAMRGAVAPRYQFFIGTSGQLLYSYQWAREMADHWQVGRSAVAVPPSIATRTSHPPTRLSIANATNPAIRANAERDYQQMRVLDAQRTRNDLLRQVQDDLFQRNLRATEENRQTERINTRAGHVLATVTGQPENPDPSAWWNWWVDEIDVQAPNKRVVIVEEDERVIMPQVLGIQPLRPSLPTSCFAAGTPVWTESGFVPIEKIRAGDRVLAQEIETGELAYKPVLATTVRQAPHHLRLAVADETIQLTSGHNLWVPGRGWMRAKDLQPGMPLHTVTGTTHVVSLEPVGPAPAFNLVVADAHTYFCGTSLILGHDVTIPELTNTREPGVAP